MTMHCRTFLAVALLAAAVSPVAAQGIPGELLPTPDDPPTRQGTRGANFLELGIGARANAMAGAITSIVEGPESWYWNPAGAAGVEQFGLSATHANLYAGLDITHNFFGAALPFLGGVVGVSFNSLNSGDLDRATETDPFGDPLVGRTFEWTSSAIGVGYARRLTDRLDLGGQLKYITEGITDAKISWVGVDLGTQFRTGIYGITIGAAIANVGPSSEMSGTLLRRQVESDEFEPTITEVNLQTEETELPTLFRFSVGSDVYGGVGSILGQGNGQHRLVADLTFNDAIDTDLQMAAGGEYSFRNIVFIRGGKRFYNDDRATGSRGLYGLSGGVGARLPLGGRAFRVDYAYTSLGDLDNVQVFSFELGR
jgi:hypothetical protein